MPRKLLFLCPHNAAKSVIAMAYCNHLAQQHDLAIIADSAGTEPSTAVLPVVIALVAEAGMDVTHYLPRRVLAEDISSADRIISMGCTAEELPIVPERIEFWSDIPIVSQQPEQARDAIRAHIEQLVIELQQAARDLDLDDSPPILLSESIPPHESGGTG
jgi:protein-tyrosine-phosphatase